MSPLQKNGSDPASRELPLTVFAAIRGAERLLHNIGVLWIEGEAVEVTLQGAVKAVLWISLKSNKKMRATWFEELARDDAELELDDVATTLVLKYRRQQRLR